MLTALLYFGIELMHKDSRDIIWNVPMVHLLLLLRQKELVEDPKKAFTFADEEFISRIKKLGY